MRTSRPKLRLPNWPLRLCAIALIPLHVLTCLPMGAWAASGTGGVSSGVRHVKAKTGLAKGGVPWMGPKFSAAPKDAEFFHCRVFEEALVPVGGATSARENKALASAIMEFLQRAKSDDLSALTRFLETYPQSPWRAALQTNLGLIYSRTGWYSKAFEAWEEAWWVARDETGLPARMVANRAVAELANLNMSFGRYGRLVAILGEVRDREFSGVSTERLRMARMGKMLMDRKPDEAFRCGPLALDQIRAWKDPMLAGDMLVHMASASANGFSLPQLARMAKELKMDYRVAKRETSDAPLMLPSVVHWKEGHYGAIVQQVGASYRVLDLTTHGEVWVSKEALESEGSGYFLVPDRPLPSGWRTVDDKEGGKVWGKGYTPNDAPRATSCADKKVAGCPSCRTPMASYSIHACQVSLSIMDTPVGYAPSRGPSPAFQVNYSQRDAYQAPPVSGLGSKWTHSWLSYVIDVPTNSVANMEVYMRGGGGALYRYNPNTQTHQPDLMTQSQIVRTTNSIERCFADGSKEVFSQVIFNNGQDKRITALTRVVDPSGNALTINYDSTYPRITSVVDALGHATTLTYVSDNPNDTETFYLIHTVSDPFGSPGRTATFDYDANHRLIRITDVIGITSEFAYDGATDNITALTTPYGITTFVTTDNTGENIRRIEVTDPMGEKEAVEFRHEAPGIAYTDPDQTVPANAAAFNNYLSYRNTYYWNKEAMRQYPTDYSKAEIFHWMHGKDPGARSAVLESEKKPLERRVWYNYAGQSDSYNEGDTSQPTKIARRLDDGTTQLQQFEYNSFGHVTRSIDPAGRTNTFTYATNLVDLLEVRGGVNGTNDLLASFTYNSQHLPLTAVDAAGQTNSFAYNGSGQLTSVTNPKGETTTLAYNGSGYLTNVTGAVSGSTTSFSYGDYGRVRTVTDSEGYTVTMDYDVLDRVTQVTYPDGTYESVTYNRLDPELTRDRLGRTTRRFYNAMRQVVAIQDALGRMTSFGWCASCGALNQIRDPLGNVTTWFRDLQGRVTDKAYADGKVVSYTYEGATSRLKSVKDAKSQTTQYDYYVDNHLKQVSYQNAQVATPTVSFEYDPFYSRLKTMADGNGGTIYSYQNIAGTPALAGRLAGVITTNSAVNATTSYGYDELGRVTSRAIDTSTNSVAYDALGRVSTATNALGAFSYTYTNATPRLARINSPNGQVTTFDYFNNAGDQRLKQIWHKDGSANTLSKFDYEYNAEGSLTKWTQTAGTNIPVAWQCEYDSVDHLLAATLKDTQTQSVVKRYLYGYDKAGNRVTEQVDNALTQASHNNVNQMTSRGAGGPMRFRGRVNEPSAVTVGGASANVWSNAFEGTATVTPGTNVVAVIAQDASGNARTNRYQVVVPSGQSRTLTYDNNGNLTNDGVKTYDWDAADRLVAINETSTNRTEIAYDGFGRRVKVVEKANGTVTSEKRFVWDGTEIAEERGSTGATVNKRFFAQGEQISGTPYYYTRDHLGSIRELVDGGGNVAARYAYDPYGRRSLVNGTDLADFGFTGHYVHVPSGLHLALFRAYDADVGRWLSREPRGELLGDGPNLYGYVFNNPVNLFDPDGLEATGGSAQNEQEAERAQAQGAKGLSLPAWKQQMLRNAGPKVGQLQPQLWNNAKRAAELVGPGKQPVRGTNIHTEFKKLNEAMGRDDVHCEYSFKDRQVVPNGTPGSVRVDVGLGPNKAKPEGIIDLKTGGAQLTEDRIRQIQQHVPLLPNGQPVPVDMIWVP